MPLDGLGGTRATMMHSKSLLTLEGWVFSKVHRDGDSLLQFERGIPSKYRSSTCVDYVPALCTHRPSLLLIECLGEFFDLLSIQFTDPTGES